MTTYGNKKLQITKELLEELYKDYTMEQIAVELGVSYKTIQRRFKEFGIETGRHTNPQFIKTKPTKKKLPKKIPPYRDKEKFLAVYKRTKSLVLVAKHFNITPDTALKWKQRHNIETIKGVSEQGKARINTNKPYANKEWLQNAYNNYTMQEIADQLNVNVCTIKEWIKRFNIKTRTVAEQRAFKSGNGNRTILSTYTKGFNKDNYLANIPYELPHTFRSKIISVIGKCQCCGFTEVLDLHHIDQNHHNNSPENLVVLCPNCHAKVHRLKADVNEMIEGTTNWFDLI